jgi:hypothetical protein
MLQDHISIQCQHNHSVNRLQFPRTQANALFIHIRMLTLHYNLHLIIIIIYFTPSGFTRQVYKKHRICHNLYEVYHDCHKPRVTRHSDFARHVLLFLLRALNLILN